METRSQDSGFPGCQKGEAELGQEGGSVELFCPNYTGGGHRRQASSTQPLDGILELTPNMPGLRIVILDEHV